MKLCSSIFTKKNYIALAAAASVLMSIMLITVSTSSNNINNILSSKNGIASYSMLLVVLFFSIFAFTKLLLNHIDKNQIIQKRLTESTIMHAAQMISGKNVSEYFQSAEAKELCQHTLKVTLGDLNRNG